MRINREGYTIILTAFLLAVAIALCGFLFLPLWIGWILAAIALVEFIFVVVFFREPQRPKLQDGSIVYSPADGKIVMVEEVAETEYLGEKRMQVSVFMSVTNVHINWYPVGGEIEYFKYHPGKFLVAWHPKSSENNERTTTVVNTGQCKILFRQIAGFVARRIVSYAAEGAKIDQNDKCGFIKFGSRVDVFLPLDAEILVQTGQKVVGSQTPLARLK